MMIINAADYASFKSLFSTLGGSKKTVVAFGTDSSLIAALEGALLVVPTPSPLPDTFGEDFPQAVAASSVSSGG